MKHWLRRRTAFQWVALALLAWALFGVISAVLFAGNGPSGLVLTALLTGFFAFRKDLLWRVRNRLLITYILFGVVPILLTGLALTLTAELLLGQFAAQRVRQDLDARIAAVRSAAESLTVAASHGAHSDLLDGIRQRVPRLAAVVQLHGSTVTFPPDGPIRSTPAWIVPGFADLFESAGHYYIGAHVQNGDSGAFAYLPLDSQTLASITPGVVSVSSLLKGNDRTDIEFEPFGSKIDHVEKSGQKQTVATGLGKGRGWWDLPIAGMLDWSILGSAGRSDVLLLLSSRASLLVTGTVTGRMATVAFSILIAVGAFFLVVEAISLLSSFLLTRAITRSVDDLYRGTLQVAGGDFSQPIPVRGQHQLSQLAASFNGMTARIRHLLGEVKKKEKLDAELAIAREVQLRLFPKSVPVLKSLEMAGVCIPGRVVSGDYYDYVRLDGRWTAVALGDVSGKGVSAALLMASIQSALHAQLRFSGSHRDAVLPTATVMESISQQLYESTPPEKYATFFCSVYDDETGLLTYTNAGHLKPILVRDGRASTLEGGGLVVGLLPNVTYEQQDVLLQTGDLLAIFSDGIPEAADATDQEFGEARLAELLVAEADKPLEGIMTAVTEAVEKWTYDPEGRDDVTLLLLRKQ